MGKNNKLPFYVISLFVCFFAFLFADILLFLNHTGSLIVLWRKDELNGIQHDSGNGYYAFLPNESVSRLDLPVYLMEDNKIIEMPLTSINQDLTAMIKEKGGGLYTVQKEGNIYFSSTDGSSPTSAQHGYSVISPALARLKITAFCVGITFILGLWLIFYWGWLKKDRKSLLEKEFLKANRIGFSVLSVALCLLLLIPSTNIFGRGFLRFPNSHYLLPLLQRKTSFLFLLAIAALILYSFFPKKSVLWLALSAILGINVAYYFAPEWNYYGVRTDTASYIQEYRADSIRTPGYMRFLEDALMISGAENLAWWRSAEGMSKMRSMDEELHPDLNGDAKGLLFAVRAQKIFLAIAFLASAWLIRYLAPPIFVFYFGIFALSGGFLGVYNSYLMSEVFSQAILLLTAGFFACFMKYRWQWLFILLSLFCAWAILIRPANVFLVLILAIAAIMIIVKSKKDFLTVILPGLAIFLFLVTIPAKNIFSEYHEFVWAPVSGYAEMGQALAIASESDIALISDQDAQDFLRKALRETAKKREMGETLEQNTYVWDIALPIAAEMDYDQIRASLLFQKTYPAIIKANGAKFLDNLKKSYALAQERTRLRFGSLSFTALLLIGIALSFVFPSKISMTGLICIALHFFHLLISIVNQPERRYIFNTEILFILGAVLILTNLIQKIAPDKRSEIPD